jgi:uncharacterized protein YbjQ (UPF0145 family)
MSNPNPQGPQNPSLPSAAQGRLHHSTQAGAAATSFTNYYEYLFLEQMGFEPLGAVMGMSVMHIGGIQIAGLKQSKELEVYSQATATGLQAAVRRLQDEAALLGADGVYLEGLVAAQRIGGEEHEYTIRGTAVRFRPQPGGLRTSGGAPFLYPGTPMSMYQMLRRGWAPCSIAYGVCVWHVPHRTLRQTFGQTFQNAEVPIFTEAWYTAREVALSRMQAQLEQHGSQLVIATDVVEHSGVHGEHTVEFRAHGTGWARKEGLAQLVPEVDLTAVSLIEHGAAYITKPLA